MRRVALVAFAALGGCGDPAVPRAVGCQASLDGGAFLMRPTATSVTVGLVPSAPGRFAVELASASDEGAPAATTTPWRRGDPGEPLEIALEQLRPGARYRYRVRCETDPGAEPARGPERVFRTLRPPGEVVRFAFLSDSHAYREWARVLLLRDPVAERALRTLAGTLGHVLSAELDFMIAGGDEVMTHCTRCPGGSVGGTRLVQNTVRSAADAALRYRVLRRIYSGAAHSVPFFLVLGNHDGEAAFGDPEGTCGHFDSTRRLSLAARRRFLAPPAGGGPDGNYFAFESGDALFAVLDVMAYNADYPRVPEDWTLGAEQLRWLEEVLAGSARAWKFVFAHHLVGGDSRRPCYAYGRGGLRATQDGRVDGPFRGEQAAVHALMRRHGARFFLYGHDHVFAFGEKPSADGRDSVHYVAGGKSSGRGSGWLETDWFQTLYDYDGDGRGDFLGDFGFLKVTVDGTRAVHFEYVASAPGDPARDGRTLFARTVQAGQ